MAVVETLIGLDYGRRRLGVAVGETVTGLARPLTTLQQADAAARTRALANLVREWAPSRLVLGLPGHVDGRPGPHPLDATVRRFGQELADHFHLPVELVDERYTTATALADGGGGREAASRRDELAAAVILQSRLDGTPAEAVIGAKGASGGPDGLHRTFPESRT